MRTSMRQLRAPRPQLRTASERSEGTLAPGAIAATMRRLVSELVIAPALVQLPWLKDQLRLLAA